MYKRLFALAFFAVAACAAHALSQADARLMRFPAVSDGQIAFSYAGDLYVVPVAGGTARRLTSHVGQEIFARFSPDGKRIAFTGQYDGNTEIYVIPSEGGTPKRLTVTAVLDRDEVSDRMGPNNIAMAWAPDGKSVVFRSRMREFNDFKGQLFAVSMDGDVPAQLPLPRGGFCSFSPDGKKLAYNRIFREFRTWKRYRGGMADDVWVYDFDTKKTENITRDGSSDIFPMWVGDRIYFLSDREEPFRMNLYVYDTKTKKTRRLTSYKEFDVKFPSAGPGSIVFENGGWIYRFDVATEKAAKVPINIANDVNSGRGGWRDVSRSVSGFDISPDGKRAVVETRGEIFSVPAKNGPTRNLTLSPGIHERDSAWGPDGKSIAYISDATGEDEIWTRQQDGSAPPVQITQGGDVYKYSIKWSPDGKKIMWSDRKPRLRVVDVESKAVTEVAASARGELRDSCWSPDSRWAAYTVQEAEGMSRVYVYSLDQAKSWPVTDGWYSSNGPEFSADGKYLFFVSRRDFRPTYSQTEWNHAYQDMSRVYLLTLASATDSPFKPKSDEVEVKKEDVKPASGPAPADKPAGDTASAKPAAAEEKKAEDKKAEDKKAEDKKPEDKKPEEPKKPVPVVVDLEGISSRIVGLPVKPASYFGLRSVGDSVYFVRSGSRDERPTLFFYDLKEQKETEVGNVSGYEISRDGKKMIVSQTGSYAIVDLPKGKLELKDKLDLSDLKVDLDRAAEWGQIFDESWRQMRDFFYLPNMHGVDWKAVKEKYKPLLPYVAHRADLTYVIGEMIGELNCGHAYVGGGDLPEVEKNKVGLLGARVERDPQSRYYVVRTILKGESWDKSRRSPLADIGVGVLEGDFIVAVNGRPTNKMATIYEALVNQAGKQVVLSVNGKPTAEGARNVTVTPTDSELNLYYFNWVRKNAEHVNEASKGKVGYIHIPDMGAEGLSEFVKQYYPQLKKKALVIDVRGNGGGNVSPMIIERLSRTPVMVDVMRNGTPEFDPDGLHAGPKVALIDEFSASDGDIFGYRFRKMNLGKLIGKRTWGGVVGIRGTLPLLDGGYLNRPEFGPYDLEGKEWVMEGRGVSPDIEVDNDPAREFEGVDDQLDAAVDLLVKELAKGEKSVPPPPPSPVK